MSQTQVTAKKSESLQQERKELQLMDEEIQIMKDKVAKMKVLNQLELEMATLALLRQQYHSHRIRAEEQMKELDGQNQKAKEDDTGSSSDSDDSIDSDNSDIK